MMDPLLAHSSRVIQRGSKSFAVAARLFDPPTREGAILLYAWCRHCDDQIDDQSLGFRTAEPSAVPARQRLDALEAQTRRALAGEPVAEPAFAALQRVVERHGIPEQHPLELLDGFAMDVEGRRYDTLEECCRYCYHVAGVVGVMMAHVMGARGEDTLDRASDLGIAFQMTNIARDVVEDARAGRVYLPQDWLREVGVPVNAVGDPAHRESVSRVAQRLLAEAEAYYSSAQVGVGRLPFRSAWAVAAARGVYRDIGRLVRERGPRAWDARVTTSPVRKLALVLRAAPEAVRASGRREAAAQEARPGLWTRPRPGSKR